jgi:glycosyltransferase involved in cell wall biosynthesis
MGIPGKHLTPDLSIVMGCLNRCRLLHETIRSVRENGFSGRMEIIAVDGGSTDGTCDWLAEQKDILTIVQPNYKVSAPDGNLRRAHSWGEFINLGFRQAKAPWILMISDDLLLCRGSIENGLKQLHELQQQGRKVGGGAMFWREYPRDRDYHVKLLPGGFAHVNHGFFWKEALEEVGYADENAFEFYGADGDLTMRLNLAAWQTVPLDYSFAEHLNHRSHWAKLIKMSGSNPAAKDMNLFFEKYKHLEYLKHQATKTWTDPGNIGRAFWKANPWVCMQGALRKMFKV